MPRIILTDRFCAGAKSQRARTDFFDANATGLELRVSESGHKAWTFHFTSPRDAHAIILAHILPRRWQERVVWPLRRASKSKMETTHAAYQAERRK